MWEQALQAAVAQSVERRIGSAEVTGPIPVSSFEWKNGNLDFDRVSAFLIESSLHFPANRYNEIFFT